MTKKNEDVMGPDGSNRSVDESTEKTQAQHPSKSDSDSALCVAKNGKKHNQRVASVPALLSAAGCIANREIKKRMRRAESTIQLRKKPALDGSFSISTSCFQGSSLSTRTETYLGEMLQKIGLSDTSIDVSTAEFLPIAAQQHSSYAQAAMAARNENLDALKALHEEGKDLQCSNAFGESIIHIVCRRGNDKMLRFLLNEGKVTVLVQDDLGRTPLHDAAWTDRPNFDVVRLLLAQSPKLLFVRDNRGNSALAYIPSQNWPLWNRFLEDNSELIRAYFTQKIPLRVVG